MALQDNKHKYDHLQELGRSGYEIVDGQPDIRGWVVKNEMGYIIGDVDELLFSADSQRVRYIIVAVDAENHPSDDERKVLVPIGVADLYDEGKIQDGTPSIIEGDRTGIYDPREDGQVVVVPINAQQLVMLPNYYEGQVDPETEMLVRHTLEGANDAGFVVGTTSYDPNDFYQHSHFDEDRFYERRWRTGESNPPPTGSTGGSRFRSRNTDDPTTDNLNPSDPY